MQFHATTLFQLPILYFVFCQVLCIFQATDRYHDKYILLEFYLSVNLYTSLSKYLKLLTFICLIFLSNLHPHTRSQQHYFYQCFGRICLCLRCSERKNRCWSLKSGLHINSVPCLLLLLLSISHALFPLSSVIFFHSCCLWSLFSHPFCCFLVFPLKE